MAATAPRAPKGKSQKPFWAKKNFLTADDHTKPSDVHARQINVALVGSGPRFVNVDSGFAIWTAEHLDDRNRRVTVKGPLARLAPGEQIACEGRWVHDKQYGWSFKTDDYHATLPTGAKGVIEWLNHRVPGVGPTYAKAIVDHFGPDHVFRVLDEDPERLREVRSPSGRAFSSSQVDKAVDAWHEVKAIREIEAFLYEHGVTKGLADKLYRRYGDQVKEVLVQDTYAITSIHGVGFKIADRIAKTMGVPLEDPKRVQAGIMFLLQEAEAQGHVFVYLDEMFRMAAALLEVSDHYLLAEQAGELARMKRIVVEQDSDASPQRLYARKMYERECRLAQRIREILDTPGPELFPDPPRPKAPEEATEEEIAALKLPTDEQWETLELVRMNRLCLLTGGPGVGKTACVNLIVRAAIDAGRTVALAAPTGKAARRMREMSGHYASTIHKLLEYSPIDNEFQRDEQNPIDADLLVVDEASMLALDLADSLFRAIGPKTHVLLVGDPDQLPPVGAGRVLADLIEARTGDESPAIPRVHLERIFRQAAKSMIVRNARLINRGEMPILTHEEAVDRYGDDMEKDFYYIGASSYERAISVIVEMVCDRIPRVYSHDPVKDIMVLAPMHKGPLGLDVLNKILEEKLNRGVGGKPPTPVIPGRGIRVGSRIMQTKNSYEDGKEVMNGEVGVIKAYDEEKKEVLISLDDGERDIWVPVVNLDTYVLAWATSVHKSQGSEYPCVVYICSTAHHIMNSRSLAYTATTRARELLILVGHAEANEKNKRGPKAAIMDSVRKAEMEKRNSLLASRIVNTRLSGVLF